MKILLFCLIFVTSLCVMAKPQKNQQKESVEKQLKVLLVTGRSNKYHNWKGTSKAIQKHLLDAGIFDVKTYISSKGGESLENFSPNWSDYDVVVLDYEGDEWPSETKKSFVKYVKRGGGVVVLHASDNSFPRWSEYNEIIGLGGWGGAGLHAPALTSPGSVNRNEAWGPRVYWKDGQVVKDVSPGHAFHPPQQDFVVTLRDQSHPITEDLPEKWLTNKDELYSGLRGPAKNLTVLATGLANPALGNPSPYEEPVLFTVSYGKGRIFRSTLGHIGAKQNENAISVNNVAFIATLQRGTEWAATGDVTQPVPDDYPSIYEGSVRETGNKNLTHLLDEQLSQWQIFVGVPHPSVLLPKDIQLSKDEPLGLRDPKKIFTTYQENGKTILNISGEIYAGLTSKEEFKNYHFQTKMRWRDKKWEPRLTKKRDSGILYHAHGEHGAFWNVWKSSLEYQVQENDMGDFIPLAGPVVNARFKLTPERGLFDTQQPFGLFTTYLHAQVEVDRPHGLWNTLEIYVLEDQAIHLVNGRVVMAIRDAKDKNGKTLTKGQLQIQSEGAEVEYMDMTLRPISQFPSLLLHKAKLSK